MAKQMVDKKGIKTIHALLAGMGMANDKEYKKGLVMQYTEGREESTTRLSIDEAGKLIYDLQKIANSPMTQMEADKKRKLILHYAHEMMWVTSPPALSQGAGARPKVDMARVNGWCMEYGYLHKPLMDYTLAELSKLVWQMQQVHAAFLKSV